MLHYPVLKSDTDFSRVSDFRLQHINRDRLKLVVHVPESLFDLFVCLDFGFLLLPRDFDFSDNDLIYLSCIDDSDFDDVFLDSGMGCLAYVHSCVSMSEPNFHHTQIVTVGFSNL